MMGYYYYDIPQAEVHDCMWSGECYTCSLVGTSSRQPPTDYTQNVPIKMFDLPTEAKFVPVKLDPPMPATQVAMPDIMSIPIKLEPPSASAAATALPSHMPIPVKTQQPVSHSGANATGRHASLRKSSLKASNRQHHQQQQHHQDNSTSHQQPNLDNKKLRHRLVEKNRHRQLQAMVKTLSDQIPARLDKETQVQTMKRAARYCIFLRKAASLLLSSSQLELQSLEMKDKLEKVYLRSCGRVELIMSQSSD